MLAHFFLSFTRRVRFDRRPAPCVATSRISSRLSPWSDIRRFAVTGRLPLFAVVTAPKTASEIRSIWATTAADVVMESGTYWPFGKPTRWYESRPNYSLFLLKSELDALLSEQPAKKRPLPKAKMSELVAALCKLDDLPNRRAQFQALCDMPEFREFKITDALFREAARQAPLDPGRKSPRQS
jgi:hypothetical protein